MRETTMPLGPFDYLIAARALRRGTTLVTVNFPDFARVPGLLVADWLASWMQWWRRGGQAVGAAEILTPWIVPDCALSIGRK
jgi:hypothetical protein